MKQKAIPTSLRLPEELMREMDKHAEQSMTDRTTIIIQALRYWLSVNGNVTFDGKYLRNQKNISDNIETICMTLQSNEVEIEKLHNIISKQNETIDTLIERIGKNKTKK